MKMNIKKYILLGFITVIFGTVSCHDYLDKIPESIIPEDEAFKNFNNFQGYVEELHFLIPDLMRHSWVSSFNWGDDEYMTRTDMRGYLGINFDFGNYRSYVNNVNSYLDRPWSTTNPDIGTPGGHRAGTALWGGGWYGIRKASLGLDAIEKGLMVDATDEERDLIAGQLHFFRAWFYFQIMQYWGGMPYFTEALSADAELNMPRLSYQDCARKAGEDFRKAADLLPINWDNTTAGNRTLGNNELRVNKIWALGYLGKNYLWAGSPLMNSGPTGSRYDYSKEFCEEAATAFAELINLVETGQTQYALVDFEDNQGRSTRGHGYSSIFYTFQQSWRMPGSTEAIMRGPTYRADSRWRQNQSYFPNGMTSGDNVTLCPAANYVNLFGMQNGLPISDYDEDTYYDTGVKKYDPHSGFDPNFPWKDRDPRFYYNFVYDGVKVVAASTSATRPWQVANLHTGGNWVDPASQRSIAETAYCNIKFITLGCNAYDNEGDYGTGNLHPDVSWLRLADVYLMYAEAVAQAYGPKESDPSISLTAADAINKIRARAGVGSVHSKFLDDVNEFMKEVRRERAVELAFESHRFHDLRRWLLLTERPYTLKTRQDFTRNEATFNADTPQNNEVMNWSETIIHERNFDSKHYWLPLKDSEVSIYEGFDQNPGW